MKKSTSHGSNSGGVVSANGPAKSDWTPPALMNMNDILNSTPLPSPLTEQELVQREQLVLIIKNGHKTVYAVGTAFAKIRDGRLYRDEYDTFENYCQKVWGLGRSYVNRQIGAAHVVDVLVPIGAKIDNESVTRPLVGLKDAHIIAAYQEAVKLAENNPVTAKIIGQAAAQFKPKKSGKKSSKKSSSSKRDAVSAQALEILSRVEQAVVENKSDAVIQQLAMLRECLSKLTAP